MATLKTVNTLADHLPMQADCDRARQPETIGRLSNMSSVRVLDENDPRLKPLRRRFALSCIPIFGRWLGGGFVVPDIEEFKPSQR
ncbi:MAG: hypothetical protein K8H99_03185 [Nitrospirae bacterium]|nr:hypothetical protein [Fimbriimonadaceae bacterium]